MQKFLKFPTEDASKLSADIDSKTADAEKVMPELAFYAEFYKDQRPFNPTVLTGVSTKEDEYLPMFSPDNELIFFTRMSRKQAKGDFVTTQVEEIIEARRPDQKQAFGPGEPLPKPFNLGDNYGGVTVSIGPAIDPQGLTAREVNARAEAWMEAEMARISPHLYRHEAPHAAQPATHSAA